MLRFRSTILIALACVPALVAEAQSGRESPGRAPWDAALTAELLRRVGEDQSLRNELTALMRAGAQPDSSLFARLSASDVENAAWLRQTVAIRGWPARSVVGKDGASAAFLIVQHADHDTAFQAAMLDELVLAFRHGEAEGQSVAMLTDRVAVHRGRPQVYGTQADVIDGRVVIKPIADSAGVDARRAEVGLMPLAQYVRIMDSVYVARPTP
jgi:hypothetical protein